MQEPFRNANPPAPMLPSGCWLAVFLTLLAGWVILATSIFLGGVSVWEQMLMSKVFPPTDLRWLFQLAYGLAVALPGAISWRLGRRNPVYARIGRALALAGLLCVCLAPARLAGIQDSQFGAVLQLLGIGLFLAGLRLLENRAGRRIPGAAWQGTGWALAIAACLGIPWVIFCALGSPLDTLLALTAGLGTALAYAWLLQGVLRQTEDAPYTAGSFFLDGLVASLALLPLAAAVGANGSGGMLALTVPLLGWAAAGLHRASAGGLRSNWPVVALMVGLGLFWPLGFVDLEELVYLLIAPGEASQWAWMAAGIGAGISLAVFILTLFLRRIWLNRKAQMPGGLLAGAAWILLLAVYLLNGHPGFYGERLFVIFKDQADLKAVSQIQDPQARRSETYRRLVAQADSTQAGLKSLLDLTHTRYQPYYLVNAIEIQSEPLFRALWAAYPGVDRVLIDTRLRPLPSETKQAAPETPEAPPASPEWNLTSIGADRVWKELGVTGKGIVVGQSDTGVDQSHPELAASYDRHGASNDYSWYDPWYGSSAPVDWSMHGTHTLGTIVGQHVGVAPGAEWIACVNLARNLGNPALYLDCMQFNFAPFPQKGDPLKDGKPEWGAQVLNNSWGCPPLEGCDAGALLAAVRALRAAGVFVAVSAGNDGEEGCRSLADPLALYAEVTSVGAVDMQGNLASFSSLGPVVADGSQRPKPDIAAPGVDVYSSVPGGKYASFSGSSMAGPHVVGVVALMWSANPKLIGDIDRTEAILRQTARPYQGALPACVAAGRPNDGAGYGVVDAYAAVQEALRLK